MPHATTVHIQPSMTYRIRQPFQAIRNKPLKRFTFIASPILLAAGY